MLIDQLRRTFAERCRKNPSYSLRAFSRSLGFDSSTISALMSGKRALTLKTARKIIDALNITNPVEIQSLLMESLTGDNGSEFLGYRQLDIEVSEAIAGWEHFAILAFLELKGLRRQDRIISEHLRIPLGIVAECLLRLSRLGLVEKDPQGWKLTGKNMATTTDIPSGALREGHRQNIVRALESLESDPVDARDVSGITMAVSREKLPEAKKMIQDFRRRLSAFMEEGNRDSVYRLNIQLVPLTQGKKS